MLNCQDVLRALSDLVDDTAATEARRRLEAHIAECRTCSVLLDSTRKTVRIVTDTGALDLPEEVSGRLIEKVIDRLRRG